MRETIREKYNNLTNDIRTGYNKIMVVDNYDFYRSNPYTIFYLNKNESFEEFKKLWNTCIDNELCYDDILWAFEEKAKQQFDYVELGTLNIYTEEEYELGI